MKHKVVALVAGLSLLLATVSAVAVAVTLGQRADGASAPLAATAALASFALIEAGAIRAYILHTASGRLVGRRVRGLWYARRMGGAGTRLSVGEGFRGAHLDRIEVGNHCYFGRGVEMFPVLESDGKSHSPRIVIGNNVVIGDYDRFACSDELVIEDHALFAAYVHISDHSHQYEDPGIPVSQQGIVSRGRVFVGEGAWIGIKAEILAGVRIGRHAVIGAGSVVTRDVPDYCIAVGNPARVIKQYDANEGQWKPVEHPQ